MPECSMSMQTCNMLAYDSKQYVNANMQYAGMQYDSMQYVNANMQYFNASMQ